MHQLHKGGFVSSLSNFITENAKLQVFRVYEILKIIICFILTFLFLPGWNLKLLYLWLLNREKNMGCKS